MKLDMRSGARTFDAVLLPNPAPGRVGLIAAASLSGWWSDNNLPTENIGGNGKMEN